MSYSPASLLMPEWDNPYRGSDILNSYSPSSVLSKLGQPVMYIARHAEVEADKDHVIRGLLNDDLNDKGEADAKQLAEYLSDTNLGGVVTDDLARTKQTALPIALDHDKELGTDINLRSWHLGPELEGKPIEDVETEIMELKNHPDKIPIGGMSHGEFENGVIESFNRYLQKSMEGDPWLLITHGSAIKVIWHYLGEEVSPEYGDIPVEPAGIFCILLTRDGFKPKVLQKEWDGTNLDE